MKFHYTCKFDPSLMVLLNDEKELMKIFRFNDIYCRLHVSLNTEDVNGLILPLRYVKLNSESSQNCLFIL